jgi:ammonia channel protein AmtB
MKKFLIALNIVVWSFVGYQFAYAAETKKACVMQKDQKTGKEKEVCKEIKVHKKLDGTKVPEKK